MLANLLILGAALVGCRDDLPADKTAGDTQTGGPSAGVDPRVTLLGRFDAENPASPASSWSATSFLAKIDGTSLSIRLGGDPGIGFDVDVDGQLTGTFETTDGGSAYPLVDGLTDGEHDVAVIRRVEGSFGNVYFGAFEPGDGTDLVTVGSPYSRRLEIVGDGTATGYGVDGKNEKCHFSAATEDAAKSFGVVAAADLDADVHVIAYSGKGVVQNYDGSTDEVMADVYPRTLTNDPTRLWDFHSYVPDAIVVDLGSTDFLNPIQKQDFVDGYVDLLKTLRKDAPDAAIFAVTWYGWTSDQQGWVPAAILASGDGNTYPVYFGTYEDEGYGCDWQPSAATHDRLGHELADTIRSILAW